MKSELPEKAPTFKKHNSINTLNGEVRLNNFHK
jgi:hypothetical protein